MKNSALEIAITYESLFDLLRIEKNKEELQQLSPGFYNDVMNYFQKLISKVDDNSKRVDILSADQRFNDKKELENSQRIITELYERRERKILKMAINKSRTKSELIDTTTILEPEKTLFSHTVSILNKHREGILKNIIQGQDIKTAEMVQETIESEKQGKTLVKFDHDVPKFIGPKLEIYGPFSKGDIANLPNNITDILLKKKRAQQLI